MRWQRCVMWQMSRNRQVQGLVGHVPLKADVTAALAHNYPPGPLQGSNHHLVIEARNLGHTAISTTSALGLLSKSSSTGSK